MQEAGFRGIDLEVRDCDDEQLYAFSVMASTAEGITQETERKGTSGVLIVTADNESDNPPRSWLEALATELVPITGHMPTVSTLTTANPENRLCVYIGDITGRAVLNSPSRTEIEAIKHLCASSTGLLWVTRGGCMEYERPESSLACGLLRSVRMEYGGKRLISLDIDPGVPDAWPTSTIQHLARVMDVTLGSARTDGDTEDFEFAERNGVIHVLRYFKDMEKNRYLSSTLR